MFVGTIVVFCFGLEIGIAIGLLISIKRIIRLKEKISYLEREIFIATEDTPD